MGLPKYYEFYGPVMKELADGEVHSLKDIRDNIKQKMNLSDEDTSIRLPSGNETVYGNRVGWAKTYLKKAGLIESPGKAQFQLSKEGKKVLADVDKIDNDYLARFESFNSFINKGTATTSGKIPQVDKSPDEILEDAFNVVEASLLDDLMAEVMKLSPSDFEKLVVKLLQRMGYGSGFEEDYIVTKASGDGGIDGIIKEDKLGFSSIYIQAKQWKTDTSISTSELQKFSGALLLHPWAKGLFITTATFSLGAKDYAKSAGIVLVDGKKLCELMAAHNLGVLVKQTYEVKTIDSDFFTDEF